MGIGLRPELTKASRELGVEVEVKLGDGEGDGEAARS
jgi:hypothetical protein